MSVGIRQFLPMVIFTLLKTTKEKVLLRQLQYTILSHRKKRKKNVITDCSKVTYCFLWLRGRMRTLNNPAKYLWCSILHVCTIFFIQCRLRNKQAWKKSFLKKRETAFIKNWESNWNENSLSSCYFYAHMFASSGKNSRSSRIDHQELLSLAFRVSPGKQIGRLGKTTKK